MGHCKFNEYEYIHVHTVAIMYKPTITRLNLPIRSLKINVISIFLGSLITNLQ